MISNAKGQFQSNKSQKNLYTHTSLFGRFVLISKINSLFANLTKVMILFQVLKSKGILKGAFTV